MKSDLKEMRRHELDAIAGLLTCNMLVDEMDGD